MPWRSWSNTGTDAQTASQEYSARRGRFGLKFIRWCEEQLKGEGVNLIVCHAKIHRDFGGVFAHLGYTPTDQIYARRLS